MERPIVETFRAVVPFATAALFAVAFRTALMWPQSGRLLAFVAAAAVLLAAPLWMPAELRLARAVAAIVVATTAVKLFDLQRAAGARGAPAWPRYLAFMISPFNLVERRMPEAPEPWLAAERQRLVRGLMVGAVGLATLLAAFGIAWTSTLFPVEHAAKAVAAFVVVYGVSEATCALWRGAGWPASPMHANYFAAWTPAEFWRRYNRPVNEYGFANIFCPAGGARRPVLGIALVFAVNGLLHEYLASIAIGPVQGLQTGFFLVQGAAVAATWRVEPRGTAATLLWRIATWLFMLGTSVLFFASVNQIVPWYSDAAAPWIGQR